jgi:hypothetical protein
VRPFSGLCEEAASRLRIDILPQQMGPIISGPVLQVGDTNTDLGEQDIKRLAGGSSPLLGTGFAAIGSAHPRLPMLAFGKGRTLGSRSTRA